MTPALALLFVLSGPTASEPPPAVVHGGRAAPRAWLAALHGALWICWDDRAGRAGPDPACWQRIDVPADGPDPRELRAVFVDAATLVVRGGDDSFQLVRGDPGLQPVDLALAGVDPRERPAAIACGPNGHVPIYRRGRWAWIAAPCSLPAGQCVASPSLPPLRRPAAPDVFFAVQLTARDHRNLADDAQAVTSATLIASVGVGFDPARWIGRRIAWQELQSARRPRLRELPPTRSTGPLASREREAVAAILCGGHVR